jgi:protein-L-isoaspartate(D-aspartate) O-methyltransferase
MAQMLELLDLKPGARVLEIGAGTGYNAALLAEMVGPRGRVVSTELHPDSAARAASAVAGRENVRVLCRDGASGAPEGAPYDRIVATVGCPDISWDWGSQLAEGGLLLVPLKHGWMGHPLVSLCRAGDIFQGAYAGWSGFMPIEGSMSGDEADAARFDVLHLLQTPSRPLKKKLPEEAAELARDLALFLTLRGHLALITPERAAASVNEGGDSLVVLEPREPRLHGPDEDLAAGALERVGEWVKRGKPRSSDYTLRFVPPAVASIKLRVDSLLIRRKTSLQIAEQSKPS